MARKELQNRKKMRFEMKNGLDTYVPKKDLKQEMQLKKDLLIEEIKAKHALIDSEESKKYLKFKKKVF